MNRIEQPTNVTNPDIFIKDEVADIFIKDEVVDYDDNFHSSEILSDCDDKVFMDGNDINVLQPSCSNEETNHNDNDSKNEDTIEDHMITIDYDSIEFIDVEVKIEEGVTNLNYDTSNEEADQGVEESFTFKHKNLKIGKRKNIVNKKSCPSDEKNPKGKGLKRKLKTSPKKTGQQNSLSCPLCTYTTGNEANLNRHLSKNHPDSDLFKCSECSFKCSKKGDLKMHLFTHYQAKVLKCSECDYKSTRKGDFNKHIAIHMDTKLFKCSECNYESNRKSTLTKHMATHSDEKMFKCSECDHRCNQLGSLKYHMLSQHSNIKLFQCSVCDYQCNKKCHLEIHILSHVDLKLFKCPECDYECNRKDSLKAHLLTHSNSKLFKCTECSYECNRRDRLRAHILSHSQIKLFKCPECCYECNRKDNLKAHMLTH